MSDSRDPSDTATRPAGDAEGRGSRPLSPLEALVQEVIRRGASLGFTSFFLTEEAVRRAFADRVPPDWVEYFARQGSEVKDDISERLAREFGAWLRTLDLSEVLGELLERYEISARIEVTPRREREEPGSEGASLKVVTRSK